MEEAARQKQNQEKVGECFPAFGVRLRAVLDDMESQGFKPRIFQSFRSVADQLIAFNKGTSHLKFGLHNITGPGGRKEALAADVIDDTHPLASPIKYLLALALAARAQGLETGILWDLPTPLAHGVEAALAARNINAKVKVGFDPTHVQVVGISATAAKAGARPVFKGGPAKPKGGAAAPKPKAAAAPPKPSSGSAEHIVTQGENLSTIAKNEGLTLARILELNPQFQANPNLIRVGDRVRLS